MQITYSSYVIIKYLKILLLMTSFIFTTGFLPIMSLVGPVTTIIASGNIYKAITQFVVDQSIKKKTGKNSLTLVKEELDKKSQKNQFNEELRQLVENRIKITRKKLNLDNIIQ